MSRIVPSEEDWYYKKTIYSFFIYGVFSTYKEVLMYTFAYAVASTEAHTVAYCRGALLDKCFYWYENIGGRFKKFFVTIFLGNVI